MSNAISLRESEARGTGLDGLGQYLYRIGSYPLMTGEDEQELAKAIEVGLLARERAESEEDLTPELRRELQALRADGESAYQRFFCCNLKLVVSIAKRYTGNGVPLIDLIQEGNIGLDRAIKKFDHRLGFKFSTYAVWWIKQSIVRALADTGHLVRIPVHTAEKLNRLHRVEKNLVGVLGRPPRLEELAAEAQLDPEEVRRLLDIDRDGVSLQTPIGTDDSEAELGDLIEDADIAPVIDIVSATLRHQRLREQIDRLPRRQARILSMRYGLSGEPPMSFEQVGRKLGVSRERVRQIEARALKALRGSGLESDTLSGGH
jgi:RNA polymerase primary sigma factor